MENCTIEHEELGAVIIDGTILNIVDNDFQGCAELNPTYILSLSKDWAVSICRF